MNPSVYASIPKRGRERPGCSGGRDWSGPAAANAESGLEIEKVIDRIVIRRDEQPRTRLELLPVHLPAGAQED